jgi:hypothetical protein
VGSTKHHDSIQSLQRSAIGNCDICRVFWNEIPNMKRPGSEDNQVSITFKLSPYEDEGTKKLVFEARLSAYIREWEFCCEPTGGRHIFS